MIVKKYNGAFQLVTLNLSPCFLGLRHFASDVQRGTTQREWWDPGSAAWREMDDRPGVWRTLMATLRTRVDEDFAPVEDACGGGV